mgnify:CR=1 FL=1
MSSQYRNIARVLKAHGSKGEVTVAPLRGLPLLVEPGMEVALTPPALNRDRFVTVDAVSDDGDTARVLFSCSSSIDDAEALQGCFILAHDEDIELDELTAAYEDLIDREVMETPANDVWVIDGGPYGEVLIPVVPHVVSAIPQDGPILVQIMDGLINE